MQRKRTVTNGPIDLACRGKKRRHASEGLVELLDAQRPRCAGEHDESDADRHEDPQRLRDLALAGHRLRQPLGRVVRSGRHQERRRGDLQCGDGNPRGLESVQPPLQQPQQGERIEERRDRGPERQAAEAEHADQHEIQQQVGEHREHAHDDGRAAVAKRVERRRGDLDRRVADEAGRVKRQRCRGRDRIDRREPVALVDQRNDRQRERDQAERRRHVQHQHHSKGARHRAPHDADRHRLPRDASGARRDRHAGIPWEVSTGT